VVLAISNASASTLNIAGTATSNAAITLGANQTLQIGSGGNLTIGATENVAGGTLNIAAGTLTDNVGITESNGTVAIGGGNTTITQNLHLIGGTFNQTGGQLNMGNGNLTGGTLSLGGNVNVAGLMNVAGTAVTASGANVTMVNLNLSSGAFNETGGSVTITRNLTVTGGTFNQTGGTVAVGNANFNSSGAATVAGTVNATSTITVGNAGTVNLVGGTLNATGGISDKGTLTGFGTVTGAITGNGVIAANGGTLDLKTAFGASSGLTYEIANSASSVLKIDGAVGSGDTITFEGTSGELIYNDTTQGLTTTLSGLDIGTSNSAPTDIFDFAGTNISLVGSDSFSGTSGTITLTDGTNTDTLTLSNLQGANGGAWFVDTISDGNGGTEVLLSDVPCFAAGTRIGTPDGEVAVEALRIGDLVMTAGGDALPLKWIGRRGYRDWLAVGNPDVQPIRFKAGSIADHVPARDLYVSPEHAMFLDGVLIPARHLVNGASILKVEGREEIEYFHLEFDRHIVILAEGAAAESFVDDDSRMLFHNADEYRALYPDEPRRRFAEFCALRIEDGPVFDALHRTLAARAMHLRPDGAAVSWGRRGRLELATRTLVSGWAFSGADAGPIALAILVNGAVVGRAVADRHRPDLEAAGIGDGRHGFRFRVPRGLSPNAGHSIEVRRESDWSLLDGAPALL